MGAKRTLSKVFSLGRRSNSSKENGLGGAIAGVGKRISIQNLAPPSPTKSLPNEINIYCVSPGNSAVSLVTYDDTIARMSPSKKMRTEQPSKFQNNSSSGGSGQMRSKAGGDSGLLSQPKVQMPTSKDLVPLLPDLSLEDDEPIFTVSSSSSRDADSYVKPRVIAAFPARDFPTCFSPVESGEKLEQTLAARRSRTPSPTLLEKEAILSRALPSPSSPIKQNKKKKVLTTFLTRSKFFQQICDDVFDTIDVTGLGFIDKKDLYNGLLLVHLQLASSVGPVACKPASPAKVQKLVSSKYDDGSEKLDRDQFRATMVVLTSSLTSRIMVQWTMILLFVPFLAQYVADRAFAVISFVLSPWLEKIDDISLLNAYDDTSSLFGKCIAYICRHLQMIPGSAWKAMLLSVITCSFGLVLVPWLMTHTEILVRSKPTSAKKKKLS